MIQIGNTNREMEPDFLVAPGGFAWWYLDLITPRGDGLVLIWSYGLPFLPGYADRARRGRPQRPVDRPSINVVVYERGRPSFYLLQEYEASEAHECGMRSAECGRVGESNEKGIPPLPPWERGLGGEGLEGPRGAVFRIGDSSFSSKAVEGRRVVDVELDCPVPGSRDRLTGTVRVEGVSRRGAGADEARSDAAHLWTPLTGPAAGSVALDIGDRPVTQLSGRAYHDRNGGRVPLGALGIDHWMWGRFPLADRELVYYLLWPSGGGGPRLLGMVIDAEGATETLDLSVEVGRERRGWAGLRRPETLRLVRDGEIWADVRHTAVVDNGPFYLRFQSEIITARGERAAGWGELCYPARVDLVLHRPLVRMRVHHAAAANSVWLPLFSGPRAGRVGRWVRHFTSARGTP